MSHTYSHSHSHSHVLPNYGFALDSHVWASIEHHCGQRYQGQASPTDAPSPTSSPTPASASSTTSTSSRLDRRLAIDFLLNPSSSSSSSSSPPETSATADREVRRHHPQHPTTTKKRRTRQLSPPPPPSSSSLLSSPDGPTSSPLSPASSDCSINRAPKRFWRFSKLPAMGLGLLDVPDLDALAAPTVVVGNHQPSATPTRHADKRTAKPSSRASRALQAASVKRTRTNSPTTTDCHHRDQATKRRRTKSSTQPSAQSTEEDEENAAAVQGLGGGAGEEDGWQFVSHNFRVCDGRAVRLTRNREFIFKLHPPPPH